MEDCGPEIAFETAATICPRSRSFGATSQPPRLAGSSRRWRSAVVESNLPV